MPKHADRLLRLTALPVGTSTEIDCAPDAAELAEIKERLALLALRKVRLTGTLTPQGRRDWQLDAHLGATAVQACGVTLGPVTTRIEEPVVRRYLHDFASPAEAEAEMPEDDSAEPLPETLDLAAIVEEALSLALPSFPRADGAELGEMAATPPGAAPIEGETEKPFAGLADLKKKLEG